MRDQKNAPFFRLLAIATLFGLVLVAGWLNHVGWTLRDDEPWAFFSGLATELGPLVALFAIAVIILDGLQERFQERQLKVHLIHQLGSRHKETTEIAGAELRTYGWLTDGSLNGANLRRAGLESVGLRGANLREARLELAHLSGADLRQASLRGAHLSLASLTETDLRGADLRGADFRGASLHGARLDLADLTGADLRWADLDGAAVSDEQLEVTADLTGATMPDGVRLQDPEGHAVLGIAPLPDGPTFADWLAGDWPHRAALSDEPSERLEALPEIANAVDASPPEVPAAAITELSVAAESALAEVEIDSVLWGFLPSDESPVEDVTGNEWMEPDDLPPYLYAASTEPEATPEDEKVTMETGAPPISPQISTNGSTDGAESPSLDLNARVREITRSNNISYQAVYAEIRRAFGVSSYRDLSPDQIPEAFTLLDSLYASDAILPDGA